MQHSANHSSTSPPDSSMMGEVDAGLLVAVAGVLLGTALTVTAFLGSTASSSQVAVEPTPMRAASPCASASANERPSENCTTAS